MSIPLQQIVEFLQQFAPLDLAESWDNVGLLLGDESASVQRVMTCLTVTPDVVEEAIDEQVQLIVSHHPLLFRPVQRIVTSDAEGRMLLTLIRAGVAIYSPHTAYDSASAGINQQLAEGLDLQEIRPLRAADETGSLSGSGRQGLLAQPATLSDVLETVRKLCNVSHLQFVGDLQQRVQRIAVACGAAAEFLPDAQRHGCDLLLTGEARFHACLEAQSRGVALVIAGHYATERPGVEQLAERIQQAFPKLAVHASHREQDPLDWSLGQ